MKKSPIRYIAGGVVLAGMALACVFFVRTYICPTPSPSLSESSTSERSGSTSSEVTSTTEPSTTPPSTTTPPATTPPTTPPPSLYDLFPTYQVYGTLTQASQNYPAGKTFAIKNGKHETFYYAYDDNQTIIKLPWDSVSVLSPPKKSLPKVNKATIEKAANEWGFESKTPFLVWTNLYRLETYVFARQGGRWSLTHRMDCASGDTAHPTPLGRYEVEGKYATIGKAGEYVCKYATGFYGNYLFHSVIYDALGKNITDPRLSAHISKGCIRLSPANAKWLYDNLPLGTAVYIQ